MVKYGQCVGKLDQFEISGFRKVEVDLYKGLRIRSSFGLESSARVGFGCLAKVVVYSGLSSCCLGCLACRER